MPRYARAPSHKFQILLAKSGLLGPLLLPLPDVKNLKLDVHFREGDRVQVYCGLTSLVDASLSGGRVRVTADPAYKKQDCGKDLFRHWRPDEPGFAEALSLYLAKVSIRAQYTAREGAVQAAWACVRNPWIPLDREAVLGYPDTPSQVVGRATSAVFKAREELEPLRRTGKAWAPFPRESKVGAELDQLAIDAQGRLVLIELKDAKASAASVYYSPLQLLQYVHEWKAESVNAFETAGLRNLRGNDC